MAGAVHPGVHRPSGRDYSQSGSNAAATGGASDRKTGKTGDGKLENWPATVESAESNSLAEDRSSFERAGRVEKTWQCLSPSVSFGKWECISVGVAPQIHLPQSIASRGHRPAHPSCLYLGGTL